MRAFEFNLKYLSKALKYLPLIPFNYGERILNNFVEIYRNGIEVFKNQNSLDFLNGKYNLVFIIIIDSTSTNRLFLYSICLY